MQRASQSIRTYCIPNTQREIRGRFQNFRKPIYRAPYLNPLEDGPDFSFEDNRPVFATSPVQLNYKLDQLRLGNKIVALLENIKKIEEVHKITDQNRVAMNSEKDRWRPMEKGQEIIQ